jgi:hypothetical protein
MAGSFDEERVCCLLPHITIRRRDMARIMDVDRRDDIDFSLGNDGLKI